MPTKTDKELLTEARELIKRKSRWTRGKMVDASDPTRYKFCAVGALIRVFDPTLDWSDIGVNNAPRSALSSLDDAASKVIDQRGRRVPYSGGPGHNAVFVNDRLGKKAAIEMFDLAIEAAT